MTKLTEYGGLAISVVSIAGTLVLLFLGREVPTELWAINSAVAGFYFGQKAA